MVNQCSEFIERQLPSFTNIVEIYKFACTTNKISLLKKLSEHVVKNFRSLSANDELLQTSFDEIIFLLKEYRKAPANFFEFLHMKDENLVLDLILRWILYSCEERIPLFKTLSELVDFERISEEYVIFLSSEYKIVIDDKTLLKKCLIDHFNQKPFTETFSTSASYGILLSPINQSTIHVFVAYSGPHSEPTRVFHWMNLNLMNGSFS